MGGGGGISPGPGALVNLSVDACTVSYFDPFCATKMHKIAPFSSILKIFSGESPRPPL